MTNDNGEFSSHCRRESPSRAIRCHRLVCKKQWPRVAVALQAMTCTADWKRHCRGRETTLIFSVLAQRAEDGSWPTAWDGELSKRPASIQHAHCSEAKCSRRRLAAGRREKEEQKQARLVRGIETRLRRRACAPTSQVSPRGAPALGVLQGTSLGGDLPMFCPRSQSASDSRAGVATSSQLSPLPHWPCP